MADELTRGDADACGSSSAADHGAREDEDDDDDDDETHTRDVPVRCTGDAC